MTLRAPAKLNLCLYVGPRRPDGLHEIGSLFCPLTLADRIVVRASARDEVVCPGVEGPNLAEDALARLRDSGWDHAPLRIEIEKRIPVAAGLGGGSADAAAVLRLARERMQGRIDALARDLGADVPSQLDPVFALVRGAGEVVEPLPRPAHFGVVLISPEGGLSTAEVYAAADRLGALREPAELDRVRAELRSAAGAGASPLDYAHLLANDLTRPATELHPGISAALEALRAAGARVALLTGSGPAVFGLFDDIAAADRAAGTLPPRYAGAIVAAPDPAR